MLNVIIVQMRRSISSIYRFLAGFLILSIMSSVIAMAAYVCPQLTPMQQVEIAMDTPCAEMDKEKPAHCAEFQSGTELALEQLAAAPALTPVLIAIAYLAPPAVTHTVPASAWNDALSTVGADPPYLRTQRLRI